MGGVAGQPEHQAAEYVVVTGLLGLALIKSLAPVGWCYLEDATARPARQETQQVAHLSEGLQAVESAAGEKVRRPR